MMSFPANFASFLTRRDGALPIFLLRFTANGTDYVLDQDGISIPPWSRSALPAIQTWGQIQQGITGTLDEIAITDLEVDLINPSGGVNWRTLARGRYLIGQSASVYLWFDGCTDPPQEVYRFRIYDIQIPDEATVGLYLQDPLARYQNYYPGTVVATTSTPYLDPTTGQGVTPPSYPDADPSDVGKIIPMPFGTVSRLPSVNVKAGAMTTLQANIGTTDTQFNVNLATGLSVGAVIQIDSEQMTITGIVEDTLSCDTLTVTRASNGTTAALHNMGATAWECLGSFDYIIASYPVTIANVWARVQDYELNINAICTKHGDGSHPSYPGMAVVTIPALITVQQQAALGLSSTLSVPDNISVAQAVVTGGTIYDPGHTHTDASSSAGNQSASTSLPASGFYTEWEGSRTDSPANVVFLEVSFPGFTGSGDTSTLLISLINLTPEGTSSSPLRVNIYTSSNQSTAVFTDSTAFNALPVGDNLTYTIPLSGAPALDNNIFIVAFYDGDTNHIPAFSCFAASRQFATVPTASGAQSANSMPVNGFFTAWSNPTSDRPLNVVLAQVAFPTFYSNARIQVTLQVTLRKNSSAQSSSAPVSVNFYCVPGETAADYIDTTLFSALAVNETYTYIITLAGAAALQDDFIIAAFYVGDASHYPAFTVVAASRVFANQPNSISSSTTGVVTTALNVTGGGRTATGAEMLTGSVSLTGDSTATTMVGDGVFCDVVSPYSAPNQVIDMILGMAPGTTQIQGATAPPQTMNGAIIESKKATDWVHIIEQQSRSWFRFVLGTPTLIVRPDAPTSVKTIAMCRLNNGTKILKESLTSANDIINTVNLYYGRDWTQSGGSAAGYQQLWQKIDPISIAANGTSEQPGMFFCDFITDPAVAANIGQFYLSWYAWQRWLHEVDVYLSEAALQFGDGVTLGFLDGQVCQVVSAGFNPGNIGNLSKIDLICVE